MILKASEELKTLNKIKKVFSAIVNDIEQGSIEVEESSLTIENNRTVFKISLTTNTKPELNDYFGAC